MKFIGVFVLLAMFGVTFAAPLLGLEKILGGGKDKTEGATEGAETIEGAAGGTDALEGASGGADALEGATGKTDAIGSALGGSDSVGGVTSSIKSVTGGSDALEGATGAADTIKGIINYFILLTNFLIDQTLILFYCIVICSLLWCGFFLLQFIILIASNPCSHLFIRSYKQIYSYEQTNVYSIYSKNWRQKFFDEKSTQMVLEYSIWILPVSFLFEKQIMLSKHEKHIDFMFRL